MKIMIVILFLPLSIFSMQFFDKTTMEEFKQAMNRFACISQTIPNAKTNALSKHYQTLSQQLHNDQYEKVFCLEVITKMREIEEELSRNSDWMKHQQLAVNAKLHAHGQEDKIAAAWFWYRAINAQVLQTILKQKNIKFPGDYDDQSKFFELNESIGRENLHYITVFAILPFKARQLQRQCGSHPPMIA